MTYIHDSDIIFSIIGVKTSDIILSIIGVKTYARY